MSEQINQQQETASGGQTGETGQGKEMPQKSRRLHDLDALRGFAMLLGIGLHACLAFFPGFWPVVDSKASYDRLFDEFLWWVHGFRMQVFFLLSGFFTTMLWRRRGLLQLLWHRFRRIVLPLAIGVFTIIPLVDFVSEKAIEDPANTAKLVETGDIWAAVIQGNEAAVTEIIEGGVSVTALSPEGDKSTLLHAAAYWGQAEVASLLIDLGADPNAVNAKVNSPLHNAAFTGHAQTAQVLIDAGADIGAVSGDRSTPFVIAYVFANSDVAEALVAAGTGDPREPGQEWSDLEDWGMLADDPAWAFRPVFQGSDLDDDGIELKSWITGFHHLWFLWFLCWFVAGFAVVAWLASLLPRREDGKLLPEGLSRRLIWLLVPLTVWPQLDMGGSGAFPVFGPDTYDGLWPPAHLLMYYAMFFAFGALMYGRSAKGGKPMIEAVGRWWPVVLPVTALVVAIIGLSLTFEDGPWWLASILQVAYAWGMVFGLIGLFERILSKQRRWVRYLSDSSYWLYVTHLPLIIAAQWWVRDWDLAPEIKFLGICIGCTAILLVSYQVFVRHTPIGWLLNGRRRRPPKQVTM